MHKLTIRSRLGEFPGLTDEVVAIFDLFDPWSDCLVRHYVLLDKSFKLMHEPFGWRDCWSIDLVAARWVDDDTLELDELYRDVIVEGNGPTYRMIDLKELADPLSCGKVSLETMHGPLHCLLRFFDDHLHGGKDFPPAMIRGWMKMKPG